MSKSSRASGAERKAHERTGGCSTEASAGWRRAAPAGRTSEIPKARRESRRNGPPGDRRIGDAERHRDGAKQKIGEEPEEPACTLAGWQGFAADWPSDQRAFKNVPWGSCVDKRTFRIMYLARIASRSFTFDCFGLGFRATCFDGDLHGTFHRIFEGHLDSEQSVLVGRFGFVRFHRPT